MKLAKSTAERTKAVGAEFGHWTSVTTLLDLMRRFDAHWFVTLVQRLRQIRHDIPDGKVRVRRDWQSTIENYAKKCAEFGMRVSFDFARDIDMWLHATSVVDGKGLKRDIEKLESATYSELSNHVFLHIPQEKLYLFEAKDLFTERVSAGFPSARADIAEAGRCLALDRHPACIFHLMRVAEIALRAIALELQVPLAAAKKGRSWGGVIHDIEQKLAEMPDKAPKKLGLREPMYFASEVKELWRDDGIHAGGDFSPERTERIYNAIRSFMQTAVEKGIAEKEPSA